jgi:signal transduction histidine kinase
VDDSQTSRIHVTTKPAKVRADAMRMRQVVEALLDNALRYSVTPAPVQIDVETSDGIARLSVADHGIGIPRAKQPHLFEQFYRAHTNTPYDRGGLGVSLYFAAQIMKQHGGRIWFESTEGRGSTFHLAFEGRTAG